MDDASLPDKCCTPQHFPTGCPNVEWTAEQLQNYAQSQHQAICDDERALAVKYWRLGTALNLLRTDCRHGQWEQLLRTLGIDKTRASRARAIARTFADESELAGLTVQEAYARRHRKQPTDSSSQSDATLKLQRMLDRVAKTANAFMDCARFAEPHEVAELLPALDGSIAELDRLRSLLHEQSRNIAG